MPGGDRTGPAGMGPMTGRAAGYCTGNAAPGFVSSPGAGGFGGPGRGRGGGGWGRGRGRGRRNWFYATGVPGWQRAAWGQPAFGTPAPAAPVPPAMEPAVEREALKRQAAELSSTLESIKQRIAELEAKPPEATAEGES
ncbi:MAG: DUF5320 domain-containing protein [Planctomycetota bacterium]